ncbi:hypothetical protein LI90_4072 [Carbonactinospora thermoautotrophica]|uniref:Lipoprotein n=1 Tax=Carbonactinospora thermoautotrophica TaxID=1469144 RepID=A0A132N094_9ACTN|nr:hypothetical protein [Carbonactinospora thermoautotrophica]KWX03022.1 hypothetical protein LI90_4072 [Carbonactinospora thermoautotrophica]
MAPSRSRRRGLAAVIAVALSLPLAGCATGFDAQTSFIKPDNPAAELGALKIINAAVVLAGGTAGGEPGTAHPAAPGIPGAEQGEAKSSSPQSQPVEPAVDTAALTMAISNNGKPDKLNRVQVDGGQATISGGAITIPSGGLVLIGQPQQPSVTLTGLRDVRPGSVLAITLSFENAGDLKMNVPVYEPIGPYATITPGGEASQPTPTPGQPTPGRSPASGVETPAQSGQGGATQPTATQSPAAR